MSITKPSLFKLIRNFDSLNHKAILQHILETDPMLLQDAAENVQNIVPEVWMKEVIELINNGQWVSAIKLTRQATGFGLKVAKDVVDTLRGAYRQFNVDYPIDEASKKIVHQFKSAGLCAAQAVVPEPEEKPMYAYVVRHDEDGSIDRVFLSLTLAGERADYLNTRYSREVPDYYVSHHIIGN